MRPLCNSTIESGNNLFEISLVQFGTLNRPAMKRKVTVLALTAAGAKRIVRSFFPRSSSYEVVGKTASLFS